MLQLIAEGPQQQVDRGHARRLPRHRRHAPRARVREARPALDAPKPSSTRSAAASSS
ncbi:MAG: hypothetical protein MZV63_18090 [Marinilabiliales bacterium]|nr:hypothetical protein [Marinilabiliales bacterium]